MLSKFKFVRWYALSSWPCEISFSLLRTLSRFDNSLDRAKQVLTDQKLLEHLDWELNEEHQGDRLVQHHTQTLFINETLSKEEDGQLWNLSEDVFNLSQNLCGEKAVDSDLEHAVFLKVQAEWFACAGAISVEHH